MGHPNLNSTITLLNPVRIAIDTWGHIIISSSTTTLEESDLLLFFFFKYSSFLLAHVVYFNYFNCSSFIAQIGLVIGRADVGCH